MAEWWISWYNPVPLDTFELHSPWWVSGYDADDRETIVAAVRADNETAAWAVVRGAYDDDPGDLDERFCEPLEGSPFSGRFPRSGWMAWGDERTCACSACVDQDGGTEPESETSEWICHFSGGDQSDDSHAASMELLLDGVPKWLPSCSMCAVLFGEDVIATRPLLDGGTDR